MVTIPMQIGECFREDLFSQVYLKKYSFKLHLWSGSLVQRWNVSGYQDKEIYRSQEQVYQKLEITH